MPPGGRGGLEDYSLDRTRILRERAGLNYREIAVHCGVTIGTARNWENGRLVPAADKAYKLAHTLGVHPADLTNTPRNQPTLRQLRQWLGLHGRDAADKAGIGYTSVYTAETYTSPIPAHIRTALATAYNVTEKDIDAAWKRGQQRAYGDIGE